MSVRLAGARAIEREAAANPTQVDRGTRWRAAASMCSIRLTRECSPLAWRLAWPLEGETLVVETTNVSPKAYARGSVGGPHKEKICGFTYPYRS